MTALKITGCHKSPSVATLRKIRHVVFDLDGTVYSGKTLFPFAKSSLDTIERLGAGYTFMTNNSSLGVKDYVAKLRRMGLKGEAENVYTSSLATLDYIKREHSAVETVFLLGTESLKNEFREAGFRLISESDDGEPDMVVAAFDTSLRYEPFCKAAWWVRRGKPYLATHPDMICPTDQPTVLLDCGALIECIAAATQRRPDKIPGKPDPAMLEGIVRKHDLRYDEVAMVGDRLYTDMEMARRAGVMGVLVLSGEATLADLAGSGLDPEVVVDDIRVWSRCLEQAKE